MSEHHQYEITHDPTYFSTVAQRYQEVVELLLSCDLSSPPQHVTSEMLESFRKQYGESEFICRFHECPHHSDGFGSTKKRDEHEATHTKSFRCADPSCVFFARGFTSKTGLQKHNRKYHPSPEDAELPKFELDKLVEPAPAPPPLLPPVEPPHPPPPPPQPEPASEPEPERPPEQPLAPVKKKREKTGKRGLRVHNCPDCWKVGDALSRRYRSIANENRSSHGQKD